MPEVDEVKQLYCHKDVSKYCRREECPMWFIPPNPEADGDCAEALNQKQQFWDTIKEIADRMAEKASETKSP